MEYMENPFTTLLDIPLIPYTDVDHAASAYAKVWYAKYKALIISVYVGIVLLLIGYAVFAGITPGLGYATIGSFLGCTVIFSAVVYSNGRTYFYKSMAHGWGWSYTADVPKEALHTTLLQVGHSHQLTNVLQGSLGERPALIGSFSYAIDRGGKDTVYISTLAKIDIGVMLPHVLFAVETDWFDNHILSQAKLVKVPLPAVAQQWRSLYTERKLEIESLQIFSPQVVQEIEETWYEYSFECIGKEIYVFGPGTHANRVELQKLFSLIQYITTNILPVLTRLQGSVVAMHEALKDKGI